MESFFFIRFLLVVLYVNSAMCRRGNMRHNDTEESADDTQSTPALSSMCHYSDPHVVDCIKRMTEQAKPLLANGIPALGIQPLEPLKIPSIRLRQHTVPKNGFKYDAWLSDVMLIGLTNFTFNKLDVYPEELKVTADISLPHLVMNGDYVILGTFQMLPVESTGKMSANFSSCTAGLVAVGARVHKRMVVREATVRLHCSGQTRADLSDAHSTTHDMEMITDHIAGMHSADIAREVQPAVETALGMVLEDVANKFLRNVPAEMVFPN